MPDDKHAVSLKERLLIGITPLSYRRILELVDDIAAGLLARPLTEHIFLPVCFTSSCVSDRNILDMAEVLDPLALPQDSCACLLIYQRGQTVPPCAHRSLLDTQCTCLLPPPSWVFVYKAASMLQAVFWD